MTCNSYKELQLLVISKDIKFCQALIKKGIKDIRLFSNYIEAIRYYSIEKAFSNGEESPKNLARISSLKDIDLAFIEVDPEREFEVFNYEEELLCENNDVISVYFYKTQTPDNQTTFNAYFFDGQFTANDYDELLTEVFERLPKSKNKSIANKKN